MSLPSTKAQPKNSKIISEQMFRSFSKISDFVGQLNDVFGSKFHEIELYNHLLSKTKLSNKAAIQRHISLFTEFCARNQDAILGKNPKEIVYRSLSYSEKIYIDLYKILNQPSTDIDTDTSDTIWSHLLVIQASIDPTSAATDILKKLQNNSSSEAQLLNGYFSKLDQNIDKTKAETDPMSAATQILQSGVLSEIVGSIDSGVKNGTLDLGKMVGTVQQMLGGLTGQMGGGGPNGGSMDMGNLMGMMQTMMGGLGGQGGNPFGGGSGGLSGLNPDKMKEQIEAQLEVEKQKEQKRVPSLMEIKDDDNTNPD